MTKASAGLFNLFRQARTRSVPHATRTNTMGPMDQGDEERRAGLAERSQRRRERIVAHRAMGHRDAEDWDLEFWQSQSPEDRLSALVAIRRDIDLVQAGRPRQDD